MKYSIWDYITLFAYTFVVLAAVVGLIFPEVEKFIQINNVTANRGDIEYHIIDSLKIFNKNLKANEITELTNALEIGTTEFKIDYHDVFAIIVIESEFDTRCTGYNTNGTIDHGIMQINSPEWYGLAVKVLPIIKKYNYQRPNIHNKNSIMVGVLAAYYKLKSNKEMLESKQIYSYQRWIQSYNAGMSGCISNNPYYIQRRERYYNKFQKARELYN